jgi:hypothetical protein
MSCCVLKRSGWRRSEGRRPLPLPPPLLLPLPLPLLPYICLPPSVSQHLQALLTRCVHTREFMRGQSSASALALLPPPPPPPPPPLLLLQQPRLFI